ncbi:MAG: zf-HC2 domain-containing protein, partial [candidate division Zixibacteria bacterium]|nr:zf-HC2 domain-containing protein [candidate division Zixibacteria bacterium]
MSTEERRVIEMDHGYFQDRLSAYHDRSLTPEEMRMVEEHVAACAECRKQLEMLAKLDRLIDEKADLAESDYWETAAQKTEQRLGFKKESKITIIRRSWTGLGWKLAAAAASVAALTFIALHEGDILDSTDKRMQESPTVSAPVMPDMAVTHRADSSDQLSYHQDTPMPEDKEVRTELSEPDKPERAAAGQGAMKDDLVSKKGTAAKDKREKVYPSPSLDAEIEPGSEPAPASVETVDELLEQVEGTVTNSFGEVFVRGGRAGQVDYIVDSIPSETRRPGDTGLSLTAAGEAMEETRDLGQAISVTGQQDIIEKYKVSNQTVGTHESFETTDDARSLDHWRMV